MRLALAILVVLAVISFSSAGVVAKKRGAKRDFGEEQNVEEAGEQAKRSHGLKKGKTKREVGFDEAAVELVEGLENIRNRRQAEEEAVEEEPGAEEAKKKKKKQQQKKKKQRA